MQGFTEVSVDGALGKNKWRCRSKVVAEGTHRVYI